jgi:hypothetical protein
MRKEAEDKDKVDTSENVKLEVNIEKQVEEFLTANRESFKDDNEAKESLIKAFKITPEKAEEYVKKMVKGETHMDVKTKVVEAKATDRWEITYVDNGKTVTMTTAQAQKKFGTAEFAEIAQGYAPHIVAINLDEKKVTETIYSEYPEWKEIIDIAKEKKAEGMDFKQITIYIKDNPYYKKWLAQNYFGNDFDLMGEIEATLTGRLANESKTDEVKDLYINEIIHLSEGLREQEEVFHLIAGMFKLQKKYTKEDIIEALKDYIHDQEVTKNENKFLEGKFLIADNSLKKVLEEKQQLDEKIEAYKMSPEEVRKLEKQLEEDEKRIKALEAEKEVMEKKNLELTEAHAKELVKLYANTRIKVLGLKIPKQFNSILEACEDFEEVDRTIREIQDGIREGIVNKVSLSEIVVAVEKKSDDKQDVLDSRVEKVMKGMGM